MRRWLWLGLVALLALWWLRRSPSPATSGSAKDAQAAASQASSQAGRARAPVLPVQPVRAVGDVVLFGQVFDIHDDISPGAHIVVSQGDTAVREVDCDGSGHYEVFLRPGSYKVRAVLPGFDSDSGDVTLVVGRRRLDLWLGPERVLRGRVLSGGQPVAGAKVDGIFDDDNNVNGETDSAGRFNFSGVHRGHWELRAQMGNRAGTAEAAVPFDGAVDVDIEIDTVGRITGRVTDGRGQPVGDALVGTETVKVRTNASGQYTLILPAGSYNVQASVAHRKSESFYVDIDATDQTLDLQFSDELATLAITVTDTAGRPLRAEVISGDDSDSTDKDGKATLEVAPGEVVVRAEFNDQSVEQKVNVVGGEERGVELRFDLPIIRGRVLWADGRSASTFNFWACSASNDCLMQSVDSDGRFTFVAPGPGPIEVAVEDTKVSAMPGDDVEIFLPLTGRTVSGFVRNRDRSAVYGAMISCGDTATYSRTDGSFDLHDVTTNCRFIDWATDENSGSAEISETGPTEINTGSDS
jgi:hypothetical protein